MVAEERGNLSQKQRQIYVWLMKLWSKKYSCRPYLEHKVLTKQRHNSVCSYRPHLPPCFPSHNNVHLIVIFGRSLLLCPRELQAIAFRSILPGPFLKVCIIHFPISAFDLNFNGFALCLNILLVKSWYFRSALAFCVQLIRDELCLFSSLTII